MSSIPAPGTVKTEILTTSPVAVVTIDFPPLNVGSHAMRSALLAALDALAERTDLSGIVLVGGGANFVAGSDIREFDAPPLAPHLPEIIERLESLPMPVVAAIKGAALGGGCELALGCDWRVASPDAVMGLPEVTLGLIPGAGGTVRLPRLVGAELALDMVATGQRLTAGRALETGLVDQVADGDVIAACLAWLETHKQKRRCLDLPVPAYGQQNLAAAGRALVAKARGADAVPVAIEAVQRGLTLPPADALALERAYSLRLRVSPQSRALRYLFQSERRAGRLPARVTGRPIHRVGVIGAGRMGSDIAFALARGGLSVLVVEANADVLAQSMGRITQSAERLVKRGELPAVVDLLDRIHSVTLEQLGDCELVVEAIPEDMAAKSALFAQLQTIVGPEAILATNTSYLDIDAMAEVVSRKDRVVGLHFFNPASILKLVEVVQAEQTGQDVLASALQLARRIGKLPILTRVGEGFVGNRIFAAYRRQCEYLLEEGCLPEEIDRAMREFGMAMGPFEVFDLAGLDIAWAMRKRLAATRKAEERYVTIPDTLCELGRFGRKTDRGWYDYEAGKPVPSAEVTQLIEDASRARDIARKVFTDGKIVSLLLTAMVNEAGWVVAEGVSAQPEDIDVAFCNGFGFPRHLAGPLYWAALQSPEILHAELTQVRAMSGRPTAPGLDAMLRRIADQDRRSA
ncbi:3-hydroxyacyl-CoA dehydrogenase NAD-binding domain-containing protein [Devosia ginsengisoli]|uniref:Multifunctional fatty acid oxidation complex subunit alpha n=1 Tax=Devosia ginsengisoli TaxID=400770 RepID=A0A5B8LWK3_9HYPH|nr:3-hydroxyacyl-CoA dehydrogenase NAD-binding domain-containing protein [Devosia ginsengisoli]QDZ11872.1 multifunctional fatty acid oxidation complex subunit alpha [Devosia ginsengisoli]